MATPRYVVGIDLGTTHCAVAAAAIERPVLRLVGVPQLVAPGEVASRELLPSFLYLPAPGELANTQLGLPWGECSSLVGELARRLGAKAPNRLVASAKSWVCHGGVNRRAPILPWSAPDEEPHVSPYAAQVAYLAHLRSAWEHEHPAAPLCEQDVVVTVPASFDQVARELTSDAAREAGLGEVRLLEEPQAAFYDFLGVRSEALDVDTPRLVLVVDVGGGTTDLTLLRVAPPREDGSRIERIAVGGHLMLGGDNMDAALAMFALDKAGMGRPTDATIWSGLVMSAREAKEHLLGPDAPQQAVVSVQGRGSRLVGNTRSITITAEEAHRVLVEGFVPETGRDDVAGRAGRAGLTTLGLPYTSDTAIPRHVCAFLRRHAHAAELAGATVVAGLPRPDMVLLNGGVFKAPALARRLDRVFASWFGAPVELLDPTSLDTAVASGAARSALARRGVGELIGGGAARAYYIEVDHTQSEPGPAQPVTRALCVAPRGMMDGSTIDVPDRAFQAVLERPVSFRLFAFTGDRADAPGTLADVEAQEEWEPVVGLQTVLRSQRAREPGDETIAVTLRAHLRETGALELYLVTVALPPERWRLGFALHDDSLREDPASQTDGTDKGSGEEPGEANAREPDPRLAGVEPMLAHAFRQRDPQPAKRVRQDVEQRLGPRGQWSAATCRALWSMLMAVQGQRATTDQHELAWLRLCGWCLRPGVGFAGDEERVDALWGLYDGGLAHQTKANWAQWWITWRQVAAGLDGVRQKTVFDDMEPWLWRSGKPPPGPHAHGPVEMLQLVAALERLPAALKVRAGELLFQRAKKMRSYWALGTVGARVPFRGEVDDVVDSTVAVQWLERLFALDWAEAEGSAFAAVSMARCTGDPKRDVPAATRDAVLERLSKLRVPATWSDMLSRVTGTDDAKSMFGDSLPSGLRLA